MFHSRLVLHKFLCVIIIIININKTFSNNTELLLSSKSSENLRNSNSAFCGDILTKPQFILDSPAYPSNYPNNNDCSYVLKGPTCPTHFHFQFLDFNLEHSLGCTKDRLEIEQQDALCGHRDTGVKSYFSQQGILLIRFISDGDGTGRGFRILITRSPCENNYLSSSSNSGTDDDEVNLATTNFALQTTPTTILINSHVPDQVPKCCSALYNTKQFIIVSPGFPHSMSTPAVCVYEIWKSHPNVCRLRMHVKFFYLGRNCLDGYLEIDGKIICGCKHELKLISLFNDNNNSKYLTFKSFAKVRNSYSGFVVEIIQDECPKRYYFNNDTTGRKSDFKFYNDQENRIVWPINKTVEKLQLVREKTEILDDYDDANDSSSVEVNSKYDPRVTKHTYYFFAGSDFNSEIPARIPKDPEETNYVDTLNIQNFTPNKNNINDGTNNNCLNWNRQQFHLLYSIQYGKNLLESCKVKSVKQNGENCIELNYIRGYFRSPGYPLYYPGNLNVCYKFKKQPGYCTMKIFMSDFNLENSDNCRKDYLLFNNIRYCGTRLYNTVSTFDLRNNDFHVMNFVTDAFYYGRGFSGVYEQITCHDLTYPINPINSNPSTLAVPISPTTVIPISPCDRIIQNDLFALNVYDFNRQICTFTIKKFHNNICKLKLYFEKFDLICTQESLVIDEIPHCGYLTGRTTTIYMRNQNPVTIVYRKSNNVLGIVGLRLSIQGVQIADDTCKFVQSSKELDKLISSNRFQLPSPDSQTNVKMSQNNKNYVFEINKQINKKFICGVISNVTEVDFRETPDKFCDILIKNDDKITKCVPIKDEILSDDFLFNSSEELRFKVVSNVSDAISLPSEHIKFNVIDCEDVSNR